LGSTLITLAASRNSTIIVAYEPWKTNVSDGGEPNMSRIQASSAPPAMPSSSRSRAGSAPPHQRRRTNGNSSASQPALSSSIDGTT
jgi:hypothetical protein